MPVFNSTIGTRRDQLDESLQRIDIGDLRRLQNASQSSRAQGHAAAPARAGVDRVERKFGDKHRREQAYRPGPAHSVVSHRRLDLRIRRVSRIERDLGYRQ